MATPYVQRVNRWIERVFNARGGSPIVDGVETQVQVQTELFSGVEERYLQGWNRFAVQISVSGVASQFSRIRIRNPVGSNVVAVVEQWFSFSSVQDEPFLTWGPTTTDLTTLVTLSFSRIDPRGNPTPTSIVSFNQQAGGGQPFLQRVYVANTGVDYVNNPNQELPILPGQAIDQQSNIANTQLISTIMWRERALEPSELV